MKKSFQRFLTATMAVMLGISVFMGCTNQTANTSDEAASTATEAPAEEKTEEPAEEVSEAKWSSETTEDGWVKVVNEGGKTLGYSPDSGVTIIEEDGLAFKDLNKNGSLDVYEDWRKTTDERAKDLAGKMSKEEIAGLMLYSSHTALEAAELTEDQTNFLQNDNVRAVLITTVASKSIAAQWNNNAQAFVESFGSGIPINASSDPRNSASSGEAYSSGAGSISMWPSNLGMAATFDTTIMKNFGDTASKEYRALGIATALSPQIDIATEPRWLRSGGTLGEDVNLAIDMTKAYADGFQTTEGEETGWGKDSVNAMIKHWPGDGPGENGRESHLYGGKYTTYPGDNFEEHMLPFTEGGFKLDGPTGYASAVMSSYSIAYSDDEKYGELVGSGYSDYKINKLLRGDNSYDGVVCTDWLIANNSGLTNNLKPEDGLYMPTLEELFGGWGISWGTEYGYTDAQRFLKILMAGHDQFGGVNTSEPVLAAYELGVEEYGEDVMRARFEESAVRLLKNVFNPGLFENPYLIASESEALVGNEDFMKAGYEAQMASVVMVKNSNNVIAQSSGDRKTVYVPQVYKPAVMGLDAANQVMVEKEPAQIVPALDIAAVEKYFDVVTDEVKSEGDEISEKDIVRNTDFSNVDFALIAINSPDLGSTFSPVYLKFDERNYDPSKGELNNGFYPISLQYRPYTAPDNEYTHTTIATDPAEETAWIAGGGEEKTSRSYAGKTTVAPNESELDLVLDTKKAVGDLPVVVFTRARGAFCMYEFEASADAVLVGFGVSDQAILEVIAGQYEPKGLLPVQMPKDMATVEANKEDVAKDLDPYVDVNGNAYDFGYGLNWSGVIADERTAKYVK